MNILNIYIIFTNSAFLARVGLVVTMSFLILSPSQEFFLGLSLANNGDMIKSQACHWSRGAAV